MSLKRLLKPVGFVILTLGTMGIFAWQGIRRVRFEPVSRTEYIMGTLVEIVAYGEGGTRGIDASIDAAFARMRLIERQVGRDPDSDLSRLNTESTAEGIVVGADTWNILAAARDAWTRTDMAFDVTVGPLVDVWGFGYGGEGRFPGPREISEAKERIGMDRMVFHPESRRIGLTRGGMAVTVGGVAKGYAVEAAAAVLAARGVRYALVNGGSSSIKVVGDNPGGRGWRVGIEDPRNAGRSLGVIVLKSGEAIGTSADTERFIIRDGKRYSHIIDPRTGYPADKGIAQVTVVAKDATQADLLTKALFLHEPGWSLDFARAQGFEALIVQVDGTIWKTPGLNLEGAISGERTRIGR